MVNKYSASEVTTIWRYTNVYIIIIIIIISITQSVVCRSGVVGTTRKRSKT